MKKFDVNSKEFVDALSYTTITQDRDTCTWVRINGRKYLKYGTLQAVTFVGNIYKDVNGNKAMFVGMTKQHPCDSKCDKNLAYEEAQLKAITNPDFVFYTLPEHLNMFNFRRMMQWFMDGMDLKMVKTKDEIIASGENPNEYCR